jgi:hypothetical protein
MAKCICGHPKDDHSPRGQCLTNECGCKQFEEEDLEAV